VRAVKIILAVARTDRSQITSGCRVNREKWACRLKLFMIAKAITMSRTSSQDSSLCSSVKFGYKQLLYPVKNGLVVYKVSARTLVFALGESGVFDKNRLMISAWKSLSSLSFDDAPEESEQSVSLSRRSATHGCL